jgi:sulfur carrier protein ThiS
MKVTLKLYATLSDYLPDAARNTNALELNLDAGTTVAQVIASQNLPLKLCHLVLIDGIFVPPAARTKRALADGETLAIWPPIAGG